MYERTYCLAGHRKVWANRLVGVQTAYRVELLTVSGVCVCLHARALVCIRVCIRVLVCICICVCVCIICVYYLCVCIGVLVYWCALPHACTPIHQYTHTQCCQKLIQVY